MVSFIIKNSHRSWSGERSDEGHRTYKVVHRIKSTMFDGPSSVLNNTPGLPVPGDAWLFDNDNDEWCFCTWAATVTPVTNDQTNEYWDVEQTFTSNPKSRCNDNYIQNPLLEPMKISGGFFRTTIEATFDRFGEPIMNSAWEQLRGPQVEFDECRPTIKIEQNVSALELPLLMSMKDCVNDRPLWGAGPRCIKLSNVNWERKYYGQCLAYYTRSFEFEANERTWDRNIMDEGSKVLKGHWGTGDEWVLENIDGAPPSELNPRHFIRAKDRNNENIRLILDGLGKPAFLPGKVKKTLFLSIVAGNLGNHLKLPDFWIPIPDIVDVLEEYIEEWDFRVFEWPRGHIVTHNGNYFVATEDAGAGFEPGGPEFAGNPWLALGVGVPVDKGLYDPDVAYEQGDYVKERPDDPTAAGNIHIENYKEANFLLLGIPSIL